MLTFKCFFETEDFQNQEITSDHLYRVQKARCREFMIYMEYLANTKYPAWIGSSLGSIDEGDFQWVLRLTSESLAKSWVPIECLYFQDYGTKQETNMITIKYNRMIAAKKAYEKAGGTYR